MWAWVKRVTSMSSVDSDPELDVDLSSLLPIAKEVDQRVEIGRVTRVEGDHLLINDKYVYEVQGGQVLKLNQEVRVRLERGIGEDHREWKVTNIEVLARMQDDDWTEDERFGMTSFREDRLKEIISENNEFEEEAFAHVAQVVNVDKVSVTLDMGPDQRRLTAQEHLLALPFAVRQGDILRVLLQPTKENRSAVAVEGAKPLRLKESEGRVSAWWPNEAKGWIDGSVSFELSAVRGDYYPSQGDNVGYMAIECSPSSFNRNCLWRAISVKLQRVLKFQKIPSVRPASNRKSNIAKVRQTQIDVSVESGTNLNLTLGRKMSLSLLVANKSNFDCILKSVKCTGAHSLLQVRALSTNVVVNNSNVNVQVECCSHSLGNSEETLMLTFDLEDFSGRIESCEGITGATWPIIVYLELNLSVQHPALEALLASKSNDGRNVNFGRLTYYGNEENEQNLVPGQRRKFSSQKSFNTRRLPDASIPKDVRISFASHEDLPRLYPILREPLSLQYYTDKFQLLLFLEELGQSEQIQQFSMTSVFFERCGGDLLRLQVPGMSDKKPSLALGDSVIASKGIVTEQLKFEGCIQEVRAQSVLLKFDQRFHDTYCGELYNVVFKLNRNPFRRMHQAVDLAVQCLGQEILFPTQVQIQKAQVNVNLVSETSRSSLPFLNGAIIPKRMQQVAMQQSLSKNRRKEIAEERQVGKKSPRMSVAERLLLRSQQKREKQSLRQEEVEDAQQGFFTPILPLNSHQPQFVNVEDTMVRSKSSFKYAFYLKAKLRDYEKLQYTGQPRIGLPSYKPRKNKFATSVSGFFNKSLNTEQKQAVSRVLRGEARPTPYIIYGPPGTGKTVTLVECTLQLFHKVGSSRILVACPSNSSADLVAQRLVASKALMKGDAIRLNAFQRNKENIPSDIIDWSESLSDDDGLRRTLLHRIVITTCATAGNFHRIKHTFTHCLIDEAGNVSEPEAILVASLLLTNDDYSEQVGQIVLAGDPKQLGPTVVSKVAKRHGLEESWLERLSRRSVYCRDAVKFINHGGFDPLLVTRLVQNYRSHEAILRVSSKLFYDDALIAKADAKLTDRFVGEKFLPNPNLPICFHGVMGRCVQEMDSPSYFNPHEALQVVRTLQIIMQSSPSLSVDDVGVVTPYRKQASKIRELLETFELPKVKIATVEEFQGQERAVIVVSTVRSSSSEEVSQFGVTSEQEMRNFALGFVQNEKRFNVAMTRAQSLLVVIGDPHVLYQDNSWLEMLLWCCQNKAYRGCHLPEEVEQELRKRNEGNDIE